MQNAEIRKKISDANLKHWEIADAIGIGEYTFCRWMRKPLTEERKVRIYAAIEELCLQKKQEAIE